MAPGLTSLGPRFAALTAVSLCATSSAAFAAGAPANPPAEKRASAETLVVPDVRRQPYVLAKSILEDAGFSWRVTGKVKGYATNLVAAQRPSPGTEIVTSRPATVLLGLERNPGYAERGTPQNTSPYDGIPVAAAPTFTPKRKTKPNAERTPKPRFRTPDFEVKGVPREPLDEMPLPERARMVGAKLRKAPRPTDALIDWWLYQHAWVVTGARFGWADGAEAIKIMIGVDQELERRFGFGAKSEAVARRALAKVERLSRA
jgi:hypothetical protein